MHYVFIYIYMYIYIHIYILYRYISMYYWNWPILYPNVYPSHDKHEFVNSVRMNITEPPHLGWSWDTPDMPVCEVCENMLSTPQMAILIRKVIINLYIYTYIHTYVDKAIPKHQPQLPKDGILWSGRQRMARVGLGDLQRWILSDVIPQKDRRMKDHQSRGIGKNSFQSS